MGDILDYERGKLCIGIAVPITITFAARREGKKHGR